MAVVAQRFGTETTAKRPARLAPITMSSLAALKFATALKPMNKDEFYLDYQSEQSLKLHNINYTILCKCKSIKLRKIKDKKERFAH
ncbi:MAG: hypothetical protein IJY33_05240 [Oscillospiraceae bacterium]|nr:hypothetical protein [Oscillospiraceae bacterium]